MVHADASRFAQGVSKKDAYEQILMEAQALFDGQRNWICNLANTASLLWHAYQGLPKPKNWAGFYVADSKKANSLILGPFQGRVACQTIAFGRGVCGSAAKERRTFLVDDVDQFPGHIACDGDSKSEIVVPILGRDGQTLAIIDVDCTVTEGFDEVDQVYLEKLARLLSESCDW